MSQWTFVIGAYSVAVATIAALLAWSFASMRRTERAADALTRR